MRFKATTWKIGENRRGNIDTRRSCTRPGDSLTIAFVYGCVCVYEKEKLCITCGKLIFAQSLPSLLALSACENFFLAFPAAKKSSQKSLNQHLLFISVRNQKSKESPTDGCERRRRSDCLVTRLMKSTIVLHVSECGERWRDFCLNSFLVFMEKSLWTSETRWWPSIYHHKKIILGKTGSVDDDLWTKLIKRWNKLRDEVERSVEASFAVHVLSKSRSRGKF